jgi:hypothetical protein
VVDLRAEPLGTGQVVVPAGLAGPEREAEVLGVLVGRAAGDAARVVDAHHVDGLAERRVLLELADDTEAGLVGRDDLDVLVAVGVQGGTEVDEVARLEVALVATAEVVDLQVVLASRSRGSRSCSA